MMKYTHSQFRAALKKQNQLSPKDFSGVRFIHLPMKMEPIECSETSAIRTQTPGNYPKENILYQIPYFIALSDKQRTSLTDCNNGQCQICWAKRAYASLSEIFIFLNTVFGFPSSLNFMGR